MIFNIWTHCAKEVWPIAKQIYAAMGLKRNDKATYHKQ